MSNYFDLICGASTGGLIALGLSVEIPASELVDFYKEKGKLIFPHQTRFDRAIARCRQLVFSAKYSNRPLKRVLIDTFGQKEMHDAKNLLCIPSYNLSAGRPKVFKSPFFENGRNRWCNDENVSMVDVALATSSAPTYFPIHEIAGEYYTDGQSYYADFFMNCISSSFHIPVLYTRIKHDSLSTEISNNIDLDKATPTALSDLSNLGTDVAGFYRSSKASEINFFFETYKSYKNQ